MIIDRKILKNLIFLSLPIIGGNISIMLMGLGDIYVAGQYSSQLLAATGIGNSIYHPIFIAGLGLCMGISPLLAIKLGKNKPVSQLLNSLILYAILLAIFLTIIIQILTLLPIWSYIDPRLVPDITLYLQTVSLGFIPVFLFQVIKEYLQAQEKVKMTNTMLFLSAVLNMVLNFAWVPEYGIKGLAFAQVASRFAAFFALLFYYFIVGRKPDTFYGIDWKFLKKLFKFSLPISFTLFIEVGGFALTSYLAGIMGVVSAAAHNIVLNIGSLAFMIPSGLGHAISIKVGTAFGARDQELLRRNANSALYFTLFVMTILATIIFTTRRMTSSLFSNDPKVIALCAEMMIVVALFQLVDGLQVVLSGILRGMKRTLAINLVTLTGFALFGAPLSFLLGFYFKFGVIGLWYSLAASLTLVCIGLYILYRSTFQKFLVR